MHLADADAAALRASMVRLARELAAALPSDPVQVLADAGEAVVYRVGSVVVKAHHPGTGLAALQARLSVTSRPGLAGVLLRPLRPEPVRLYGRWVTAWPAGATVSPDPDAAPWPAAARLLAALHRQPWRGIRGLPPSGAVGRVRAAVRGLESLGADPEADAIRDAWRALPPWARDERPPPRPWRLAHGDWHFGQLIGARGGSWLLSDIDDLGFGPALWDFGRPAAFRAIGVVPADTLDGFLDAYRAAGGSLPDVPATWTALDLAARAFAVQTAARRLLAARRAGTPPDDVAAELIAACRRMVRVPLGLRAATRGGAERHG